jgi:hypothetical protein
MWFPCSSTLSISFCIPSFLSIMEYTYDSVPIRLYGVEKFHSRHNSIMHHSCIHRMLVWKTYCAANCAAIKVQHKVVGQDGLEHFLYLTPLMRRIRTTKEKIRGRVSRIMEERQDHWKTKRNRKVTEKSREQSAALTLAPQRGGKAKDRTTK